MGSLFVYNAFHRIGSLVLSLLNLYLLTSFLSLPGYGQYTFIISLVYLLASCLCFGLDSQIYNIDNAAQDQIVSIAQVRITQLALIGTISLATMGFVQVAIALVAVSMQLVFTLQLVLVNIRISTVRAQLYFNIRAGIQTLFLLVLWFYESHLDLMWMFAEHIRLLTAIIVLSVSLILGVLLVRVCEKRIFVRKVSSFSEAITLLRMELPKSFHYLVTTLSSQYATKICFVILGFASLYDKIAILSVILYVNEVLSYCLTFLNPHLIRQISMLKSGDQSRDDVLLTVDRLSRYSSLAIISLYIVFILNGDWFIAALPISGVHVTHVQLVFFSQLFNALTGPAGLILSYSNQIKIVRNVTLCSVFSLVLGVILLIISGLIGVTSFLWVYVIISIVTNLVLYYLAFRRVGYAPNAIRGIL